MRYALLLSGQMRTFDNKDVVSNIHSCLIDKYNCDVFVSTWDERGYSYCHGSGKENLLSKESITVEKIRLSYKNVKDIQIDNFQKWLSELPDTIRQFYEKGFPWDGVHIKGTSVPFLYKLFSANEMKKNYEKITGIKYDVVFCTRPDCIFVNSLKECYLTDFTKLYAINCHGTYWPHRVYDIFFYSNSENIDKISDAYGNIIELANHPYRNGLHPKDVCRMLYVQALKWNITIIDMDYNPCFIFRG
jgi:hypothetical protein